MEQRPAVQHRAAGCGAADEQRCEVPDAHEAGWQQVQQKPPQNSSAGRVIRRCCFMGRIAPAESHAPVRQRHEPVVEMPRVCVAAEIMQRMLGAAEGPFG